MKLEPATSSKATRSHLSDQPRLVLAVLPAEQVGHAALAAREQDHVGRELAVDIRLASPTRPQLDQVVVLLHHRDEPQQEEQLAARREVGVRRLVAHRPEQDVDPLVAGKRGPALQELVEVRARDLDR